jgi:glycosyltransferase involved in cell wall biosynthesis
MKSVLMVASKARSLVNFRGPLIMALIERGIQVHVAAPKINEKEGCKETLKSWGVHVHELPMDRAGIDVIRDARTFRRLWVLMREVRPEAFFAYTVKPVIYGCMAARFSGIQYRFPLITGLGYAFIDGASRKRNIVRKAIRLLYKISLKGSKRIFFQNPDDQALFREMKLVAPETKSVVVNGSGVDTDRFSPANFSSLSCFIMIGRFLGDKGIREYFEAARIIKNEFPDARFLLVGFVDDNPNSVAQEEVDSWINSGVIECLGKLDDVRPALAEASVFVLPSYREGTPRTVLEAMSMGRPIITTDAPGCRETVIDGKNGYLVPVKSSVALADAMRKFIENPEHIAIMGAVSRQIAEDKYDADVVAKEMVDEMIKCFESK